MVSRLNIDRPELIPVVEFEPGSFHQGKVASPRHPCSEHEWTKYWIDSLAVAGVTDVSPIKPGSWHVPVASLIHSHVLAALIAARLEGGVGPLDLDDPDQWPSFSGGGALVSADHGVVVQPRCCCSLFDLREWRDATVNRPSEWEMLWIGHPWIYIRYENEWIVGRDSHDGCELALQQERNSQELWAVRVNDLVAAVNRADRVCNAFAERLIPHLEQRGVREARSMARTLAGIDRP